MSNNQMQEMVVQLRLEDQDPRQEFRGHLVLLNVA
jgi:hypothetical protein